MCSDDPRDCANRIDAPANLDHLQREHGLSDLGYDIAMAVDYLGGVCVFASVGSSCRLVGYMLPLP